MEDVVESERIQWSEQLLLLFLLRLLQILSLALDLVELLVAEDEDGHCGAANEVSVSIISHHEGSVVDDCTSGQSLNHEILILSTAVILHGDLNDAILDEEHVLRPLVLLAD